MTIGVGLALGNPWEIHGKSPNEMEIVGGLVRKISSKLSEPNHRFFNNGLQNGFLHEIFPLNQFRDPPGKKHGNSRITISVNKRIIFEVVDVPARQPAMFYYQIYQGIKLIFHLVMYCTFRRSLHFSGHRNIALNNSNPKYMHLHLQRSSKHLPSGSFGA